MKVGLISSGIRAETGSGPIVATLARGGSGFTASRLETSVGDITGYLPDGLAVTIRADVDVARGVGINSDFPELKIARSSDLAPRGFYPEGNLNGGGPLLDLHTSPGHIEFKPTGT